ncbi:alpha/beta hydrolase [Ferrimonas kyonanensis]|uniref:alpha/beta hydrolase n=1 Tax=Ferrimonas kyonanensis TaxID=364763 RepID=UPI0003FF64EF|nr:alpha/beta hydrolase [Ferrimonas kyonanensis]
MSLKLNSELLTPGTNKVSFPSEGHQLAGLLFLPEGFDASQKYPTIVMTMAFNQVKEQTGSVYGKRLAALGYAAMVFDHRGFGDSEGKLRSYEYTPAKLEGLSDAISFLRMHDFVDRARFFGLGVCAGASHIVTTALTDKRLKAIATVSGMLNNAASLFGVMDRETAVAALTAANDAHQKYYETGIQENVDILGMSEPPAEDAPSTMHEGYDYYMTARAGRETNPNYTHMAPLFVNEDYPRYNATAMAPFLYTPFLGIVGKDADTAPLTQGFVEAASEPKELYEIEGASHVSLYDIDKDVDRAVTKINEFFQKHGS